MSSSGRDQAIDGPSYDDTRNGTAGTDDDDVIIASLMHSRDEPLRLRSHPSKIRLAMMVMEVSYGSEEGKVSAKKSEKPYERRASLINFPEIISRSRRGVFGVFYHFGPGKRLELIK
jgi:hypothetical protein